MKTFFEKVMTLPLPAARSSVAAVRSSLRGDCSASRRVASRLMECSVVCIGERAWVRKEFNTQDAEKRRSAEEVFGGGADDAGRRLGYGHETIAANQNNRVALRLAHQETGGGGEFVGNREDPCKEPPAVTVFSTPPIQSPRQS